MSIKTLKSRLAASGLSVVLLVTATVFLQHAGATSSSSPFTACYDEIMACYDDAACMGCFLEDSNADEYTECIATYEYDWSDPCVDYSNIPCCLDSVSPYDCLGNYAFVEYYVCFNSIASVEVGGNECSTVSCSDSTGGVVAGNFGAASSSPSAMLTYVLGLGFLTAVSSFQVFL